MEKSTVVGHRKGSGICGPPSVFGWVLNTTTHPPLSTALHTTYYAHKKVDDHISLTPSYTLQLCSFQWLLKLFICKSCCSVTQFCFGWNRGFLVSLGPPIEKHCSTN